MSKDAVTAELALIGGLMYSPSQREYIGALDTAHFYDPMLGALFAEIVRRIDAGLVADAVTLKPWLAQNPHAKEVPALLMNALEVGAATASQAAAYADEIRNQHARRAAVRVHTEALARLQRGDDVLEVLAQSEDSLRDLGHDSEASAADLADAAEGFLLTMDKRALSTGLEGLDDQLGGLFNGELIILAGRPSMGKTSLAAVIARAVAARGRVAHFASLEMPKEQLAARAISAASYKREYGTERVQYYALRNGSNVDRRLLAELAAELPRTLAIDDRPAQTVAQLERAARATRRKHGRLDLIVVDYLQLMTSKRSDGRVNEVTEISQGLKALAKRLGVPVLALSQLSRGVESRDNKRPTLADLRDSGAIEQDADVVIGCYRPAYY
ncbi:MAG: DnaB-like helicase C-terminal domain-containing protein, partial [Terricaulis sp.]